VKALAAFDNSFFSASRDLSIISWLPSSSSPFFTNGKKLVAHSNFVNSLFALGPTDTFPAGLLFSGSSDKSINVFDLGLISQSDEPAYTLLGHLENVCSLYAEIDNATGDIILVSGSWDKTIKIWRNFECVQTLTGHTQAVWSVIILKNGSILSASADKTIKLWSRDGKLLNNYVGHTDAIRGLVSLEYDSFLSCSNDGSIRIWNISGSCIAELVGHSSFVYSVGVLQSGEIVSSGEDRTVRVWKGTQCIQTINHPCTSIWSVLTLNNGDIVSGGSDGVVRIFSRSDDRILDANGLKAFDEEVAKFAIPSQSIGQVDKSKVPGPEALEKPGKKDQESIMVNVNGIIEAHQWNGSVKKWEKIGEVVDSASSDGSSKAVFDGKEYDYVFDVDFGTDGQGSMLKLPYNLN
ncbi:hypothetical protein HK096_005225, partial [Nowakowskiella sp. JEL0078]